MKLLSKSKIKALPVGEQRDSGKLLRGGDLEIAERWFLTHQAYLIPAQKDFIQASIELRSQEQAARELLRKKIIYSALGASVVCLLLAIIAGIQWKAAKDQKEIADGKTQAARTAEADAKDAKRKTEDALKRERKAREREGSARALAVSNERLAKVKASEATGASALAREEAQQARKQKDIAEQQRTVANQQSKLANQLSKIAHSQTVEAEQQKKEAQRQEREAHRQKQIADVQTKIATEQTRKARNQRDEARVQLARVAAAKAKDLFQSSVSGTQLSVLLALESYKLAPDKNLNPEAAKILREGLSFLPPLVALLPQQAPITSIALSPVGDVVAVKTIGGKVNIIDVATQKRRWTLEGSTEVSQVGFILTDSREMLLWTADSEKIQTWGNLNTTANPTPKTVFSLAKEKALMKTDGRLALKEKASIEEVAAAQSWRYVIIRTSNITGVGYVFICDLLGEKPTTSQLLANLAEVAICSDGSAWAHRDEGYNQVVVRWGDSWLRGNGTQRQSKPMRSSDSWISGGFSLQSGENYVASRDSGKAEVVMWLPATRSNADTSGGVPYIKSNTIKLESSPERTIFSPDGNYLAVLGDNPARIFNIRRTEWQKIWNNGQDSIGDNWTASFARQGEVARLFHGESVAVKPKIVPGHVSSTNSSDRVTVLSFSADNRIIATAGTDNTVRIWDWRKTGDLPKDARALPYITPERTRRQLTIAERHNYLYEKVFSRPILTRPIASRER